LHDFSVGYFLSIFWNAAGRALASHKMLAKVGAMAYSREPHGEPSDRIGFRVYFQ
jgi:hypothetical protein